MSNRGQMVGPGQLWGWMCLAAGDVPVPVLPRRAAGMAIWLPASIPAAGRFTYRWRAGAAATGFVWARSEVIGAPQTTPACCLLLPPPSPGLGSPA